MERFEALCSMNNQDTLVMRPVFAQGDMVDDNVYIEVEMHFPDHWTDTLYMDKADARRLQQFLNEVLK